MNQLAVAYYPEHVDEALWAHDLQRMLEGGITAVRILEFAWGRLEPREGEFTFDWVDRFMQLAQRMGMQVIPCTPTAAQPPWMIVHHPETTMNGHQAPGFRRQYCFSSPKYRKLGLRISRKLAGVMRQYPNVIGWQIDNELGFNFCQCPQCLQAYQAWLQPQFHGDIQQLNQAWGLVFWSAEYSCWGDIRFGMMSPESKLAEKRFFSHLVVDFLNQFVALLREEHPGVPITTNMMANFEQVDYFQASKALDVLAFDFYYMFFTMESLSMGYDLFRCLKRQPFWTLEDETGWNVPDGFLSLLAVKGWAHGETLQTKFPWRAFNTGLEQVASWGLINHNDRPTRAYTATQQTAEIYRQLPELTMDDFAAQVGFVYSYENIWAGQALGFDYPNLYLIYDGLYKSINRLGVFTDVISETDEFSRYRVLVIPPHYLCDQALADKVRAYVADGGTLIMLPHSFTRDRQLAWQRADHPFGLTDVFGAYVGEWHFAKDFMGNATSALGCDALSCMAVTPPGIRQYGLESMVPGVDGLPAEKYFEMLVVNDANVWATYADGVYASAPAITAKQYGNGHAIYLGTFLPEEGLRALYRYVLGQAGVAMCPPVNAEVEVVPLRRHRIYLNHTSQAVREPKPAGTLILGTAEGEQLALPAYGYAIVQTEETE